MCRHYTDEDLTALAAGDMTHVSAWRMRRHITRCPACRAHFESIHDLWAQARIYQAITPPPPLHAQLSALLSHISHQRPSRVCWQPLAALATGVALILFVSTVFPGSGLYPKVAFAEVQQAMQKVASASWTMDITADSPSLSRWHENTHRIERVWVQEYPPIIIRQVKNGGIMVWNEEGFQRYKVSRGHYKLIDHRSSHGVADNVETMLRKLTERPGDVEHSALGETAGPWKQRPVETAGRVAIRFTRTVFLSIGHSHGARFSTDEDSPSKDAVDKPIYLRTETVWADPKTKRLLRSEERWGPSFPTHVTCKDFEYSQPIPTDLVNIRNGRFAQQAHWP